MNTRVCRVCGEAKDREHFEKERNTCYACRYQQRRVRGGKPVKRAAQETMPLLTGRTDGEKMCGRCKQVKPRVEFSNSKNKSDGRSSWCKACHRDYWHSRNSGSAPTPSAPKPTAPAAPSAARPPTMVPAMFARAGGDFFSLAHVSSYTPVGSDGVIIYQPFMSFDDKRGYHRQVCFELEGEDARLFLAAVAPHTERGADEYVREMDALRTENATLASELEATRLHLERAEQERQRAAQRSDDLERRLDQVQAKLRALFAEAEL